MNVLTATDEAERYLDDLHSCDPNQTRRVVFLSALMDTLALTDYEAVAILNEWARKRKVVLT